MFHFRFGEGEFCGGGGFASCVFLCPRVLCVGGFTLANSPSRVSCSLFCLSEVRLFVCLSVCLSVCMSVCLSFCLSVCMSVCLSVCLPVCLSACLRLFLRFPPSLLHDLLRTQPLNAKDPTSELAPVDKGKTRPQTVAKGLGMKVYIFFTYPLLRACCCSRAWRLLVLLCAHARSSGGYQPSSDERNISGLFTGWVKTSQVGSKLAGRVGSLITRSRPDA